MRVHLILFATTIFLSAFLLFEVQPMMGRFILPWFGGTPAVWSACMLFFQALLLVGYAYAHYGLGALGVRRQALLHAALAALAIAMLPVAPDASWRPTGGEVEVAWILALLAVSVGAPYLILSATSPLLQAWFHHVEPERSPYPLYAVSNVGSLLALVCYPFVVEPALSTHRQSSLWSIGYVALAVAVAVCAARTWRHRAPAADAAGPAAAAADETGRAPTIGDRALWLGLTACASVLLLAVTNQVCQDVAVIPFLWVAPLGIYLLSFILAFGDRRWYARPVFCTGLLVGVGATTGILFDPSYFDNLQAPIGIYLGTLFCACMVCHGELVRLRPPPRWLTGFFLTCAAGGAAGGALVSLVAPLVFAGYHELHLGLVGALVLMMAALWREPDSPLHDHLRLVWIALLIATATIACCLGYEALTSLEGSIDRARNFYGVLRVADRDGVPPARILYHGRIVHGVQVLTEADRRTPTTYYDPPSGVGLALRLLEREGGRRVGAVGLGAGTIAAYGRTGDLFRFYEIDPDVEDLARAHFTFIADSAARVEVEIGDARTSLEREPPQRFDLLVLDAFSGDAVPVHLLTTEAFALYLRHLADDGALAIHVSNLYLDIWRVVVAQARHHGLRVARIFHTVEGGGVQDKSSDWMLLTRETGPLLDAPEIRDAARTIPSDADEAFPRWTDDYSNLFEILR